MEVSQKEYITLEVTAKTNTGMQREANEDNFVVTEDSKSPSWILPKGEYKNSQAGTVLVVADGMGGLNAGEVASKIAVNSIEEFLRSIDEAKYTNLKQVLIEAIVNVNNDIVAHSKNFPETAGMGSTIVVSIIRAATLHLSWVGDSRCYLFRNNELTQLSKDHSYVQTLVDQGKLTKEQAFVHPDSNIITQSLGDDQRKPKPDYVNFSLDNNDIVLLCSDGLNGMLEDGIIAKIIAANSDLSEAAKQLIEAANEEGGHDNITVVMARVVNGANSTVGATVGAKTIGSAGLNNVKKKSKRKIWLAVLALGTIAIASIFAINLVKKHSDQSHQPHTKDTIKTKISVRDTTNRHVIAAPEKVTEKGKANETKEVRDKTSTSTASTTNTVHTHGPAGRHATKTTDTIIKHTLTPKAKDPKGTADSAKTSQETNI